MSKIKEFLMDSLEKAERGEVVWNPVTNWYEPNMDNPTVVLAFAEAEFESSLEAMRNALTKLDEGMPARIEASEKIIKAIKQVESWAL